LALVAIGTTEALEHVGEALLQGDEDLRRAAAEALANDNDEGYAMLRDGATMTDIPLRRAAAYGLGRIREIWATELLEKMRSDDDQWVVRNAAAEILDSRSGPADPRVPRQLPPPSEAPWLIAFAGTLGVGISPGAPATDVLIAALKSPNQDERLAALAYLKRAPSDGVIREMYAAMGGDDEEVREAAFLGLCEIGASGHKLPDQQQLGFN
jgi:HEAT repeat protein